MNIDEFIDKLHIITSDLHWTEKDQLDKLLINFFNQKQGENKVK